MRELAREITRAGTAVLKGGTALLLAYGLNRFSEDMDFDIPSGSDIDITQMVAKVAKKLDITNYQINIKKDTDTTKRYMLHYGATRSDGDYPLKIEFSKRNKHIGQAVRIDGISVYEIGTLSGMKTHAFIGRAKPRDMFDVSFLLSNYYSDIPDDTKKAIVEHVEKIGINVLCDDFEATKIGDPLLEEFDGVVIALGIHTNLEKFRGKHVEQIKSTQGTPEASKHNKPVEMDRDDEQRIHQAATLLQSPRALDNSQFRGRELSSQTNETLDLIEQLKRNLEDNKTALKKINAAGISVKDISDKNIGRKGIGPLKGYEVVSRTKDGAILLKGRSLYIYELRLMELQPPASGLQEGDKVNVAWPYGVEKARVQVNVPENKQQNSQAIQRGIS